MTEWWERLRVPIAILVIVGLGMVVAAQLQSSKQSAGAAGAPAKQASPPAPTRPAVIQVHVAGAVRSPGVYTLTPDKRVKDAIAAAGGPIEGADPHRLNQAAILKDGEQVLVPRANEPAPAPAQPESPAAKPAAAGAVLAAPTLIDLNRAGAAELETLPGIGPVTAGKIVKHREANGPFTSVDQLREQKLVNAGTLEKIRASIVVK